MIKLSFYIYSDTFKATTFYSITPVHKRYWYVLDSDDLVTEIYSSEDIIRFYKQGVHFENIVKDEFSDELILRSIFQLGKAIEFKAVDLMFFTEYSKGYMLVHTYFKGYYYVFEIDERGSFPDFDVDVVTLHATSMMYNDAWVYVNLEFNLDTAKVSALQIYSRERIYFMGEPCTEALFKTKALLGV